MPNLTLKKRTPSMRISGFAILSLIWSKQKYPMQFISETKVSPLTKISCSLMYWISPLYCYFDIAKTALGYWHAFYMSRIAVDV